MPGMLHVHHIQFFDENPLVDANNRPAYPGAEGAIWYEVTFPAEEGHVERYAYMNQPFTRDGPKHQDGASPEQIAKDQANIWQWDGNRAAPSLTPSFLCLYGAHDLPEAPYHHPGFRAHLFLHAGIIDLCGDSEGVVVGGTPSAW